MHSDMRTEREEHRNIAMHARNRSPKRGGADDPEQVTFHGQNLKSLLDSRIPCVIDTSKLTMPEQQPDSYDVMFDEEEGMTRTGRGGVGGVVGVYGAHNDDRFVVRIDLLNISCCLSPPLICITKQNKNNNNNNRFQARSCHRAE